MKSCDPKARTNHTWRVYILWTLILGAVAFGLLLVTSVSAGILQQSRSPMAGVHFSLLNSTGAVISTTVSDAQGRWSFEGAVGENTVQVDSSNFVPGGALYGMTMTGSACGVNDTNSCTFTIGGGYGPPPFGFTFSSKNPPPRKGDVIRVKSNVNAIEGWNGSAISLYSDGVRYDNTFVARNGMTSTGSLQVGTFERVLPRPALSIAQNGVITPTGSYQPILSNDVVTTSTLGSALFEPGGVTIQQKLLLTPAPIPTPLCYPSMSQLPYCTATYTGGTPYAPDNRLITQTYSSQVKWATALTLQNTGAYTITVFYRGLQPSADMRIWSIWTSSNYTTRVGAITILSTTLTPGSAVELWYDRYSGWIQMIGD